MCCALLQVRKSSESSNEGVTAEPLVEAEPRPLQMEPRRRRKHKPQGFKSRRRLTSSLSSFNSSRSPTSSLDGSGHRRSKRSSRHHGKCRSSIGITDTTAPAHLGHAQTPPLISCVSTHAKNTFLAIRIQTTPQDSVAAGQISDHHVPAVFLLSGCIGLEIRQAISGGCCQKQVNNLPIGRTGWTSISPHSTICTQSTPTLLTLSYQKK